MKKKQQSNNHKPKPKDHPTDDFCEWWNPTGVDEPSGAAIGGHPEAKRVHARKDPGRWVRHTYGITAVLAWQCRIYRDEYQRWVDAGKPEREPYVSIAAPLERHRELARELSAIVRRIGKPMPEEDDDEEIKFDEPA
jgi:hypothetical protein